MVLYAADLDDLEGKPLPVEKKSRKRKQSEPVQENEEPKLVEKKKRVMTDKQKEALLKGQETRRLKKEAAEKEKKEQEELAAKLLNAAKKPRAKKTPPTPEPTPESSPVKPKRDIKKKVEKKEEIVEEVKPVKGLRKSIQPPEWFKKYVEGVQKEKAATSGDEVSKKQENIIKNEALKVAKKSWESGYTRDRVQHEVDNHMNRMYSMIFGR